MTFADPVPRRIPRIRFRPEPKHLLYLRFFSSWNNQATKFPLNSTTGTPATPATTPRNTNNHVQLPRPTRPIVRCESVLASTTARLAAPNSPLPNRRRIRRPPARLRARIIMLPRSTIRKRNIPAIPWNRLTRKVAPPERTDGGGRRTGTPGRTPGSTGIPGTGPTRTPLLPPRAPSIFIFNNSPTVRC